MRHTVVRAALILTTASCSPPTDHAPAIDVSGFALRIADIAAGDTAKLIISNETDFTLAHGGLAARIDIWGPWSWAIAQLTEHRHLIAREPIVVGPGESVTVAVDVTSMLPPGLFAFRISVEFYGDGPAIASGNQLLELMVTEPPERPSGELRGAVDDSPAAQPPLVTLLGQPAWPGKGMQLRLENRTSYVYQLPHIGCRGFDLEALPRYSAINLPWTWAIQPRTWEAACLAPGFDLPAHTTATREFVFPDLPPGHYRLRLPIHEQGARGPIPAWTSGFDVVAAPVP